MGKQYLTFKLADTVYAVNVFQVREVLSYTAPQPLPKSDPVIEGLIRSRGQSIPVVNLRRKFSLADKQPDAASRIIVVEVNNYEEGSISVFGAVADSVNEVLDLDTIGFEDTPELGHSAAAAFIDGIGRQGDAFIIILDVDKIFSFDELSEMNELDNRTVAPEYAQYTQELPPHRQEPPKTEAPPPVQPVAEESQAVPARPEAQVAVQPAAEEPPIEAPQVEARVIEEAEPEEALPPETGEEQSESREALAGVEAEEPAQEADVQQVLPAVKTPPVSVQPAAEAPAQEEAVPQEQKKPSGADSLDGRYDALDFATEDFELL